MSTSPPTTVAAALAMARALGVARLDAQLLLAHHLGRQRAWVLAHDADALPAAVAGAVRADLQRRAEGVPLAYLTGRREFHGLTLHVGPEVLDPRADTETLVDWALELLGGELSAVTSPQVVDLGTGSGAIALAVKHACPRARVRALDASAAALAVARGNGERLRLAVDWLLGDWWSALPPPAVHLALSNPPYIAADDTHLPMLRHEPRLALTPGGDGLAAIDALISGAAGHLRDGGWLLLEHGHDQGPTVRQRLADAGFERIDTRLDLAGHERCTGGRRPHAGADRGRVPATAGAAAHRRKGAGVAKWPQADRRVGCNFGIARCPCPSGALAPRSGGSFCRKWEPAGRAEDYDARKGRYRPHRPSPPVTGAKEWKMYRIPLVCLFALLGASAGAQNGLNVTFETTADLRTPERSVRLGLGDLRLDMAVSQVGSSQAGGRLLCDYYLTGPGFGDSDVSGGLRLTSGLAVGPRETIAALPVSRTGGGLQLGQRDPGHMLADRYGEQVTLPYIGIGYTTLSLREGWGLSADIGLGGQRPGERVRFGGNPTAAQFESVLNDLRLAPVIQLGVSYAF